MGVLSGEQQDKTIKIGSSDVDLTYLPLTLAIRVGGATANNHLVELNEKTTLENINFGNALEKTEVRSLEQFGGTEDDHALALVTDPSGNSFLAGTVSNNADFNEVHSPTKRWMTEFLPNTIQLENWPGNY